MVVLRARLLGDVFGDRIRAVASDSGAEYDRLRATQDDWNDELKTALRRTS